MTIGPSFAAELATAGVLGTCNWTADGDIIMAPGATAEQTAAVQAVLAAHDPTKPDTVAQIASLTAACTATITAALTSSAVSDWPAYRQTCLAQLEKLTAQLKEAATVSDAEEIVWTAPATS